MASSAIDQLLQIVSPVRGVSESGRSPAADVKPFAGYLGRASGLADQNSPVPLEKTTKAAREESPATDRRQEDAAASSYDERQVATSAIEKLSSDSEEDSRDEQNEPKDAIDISAEAKQQGQSQATEEPTADGAEDSTQARNSALEAMQTDKAAGAEESGLPETIAKTGNSENGEQQPAGSADATAQGRADRVELDQDAEALSASESETIDQPVVESPAKSSEEADTVSPASAGQEAIAHAGPDAGVGTSEKAGPNDPSQAAKTPSEAQDPGAETDPESATQSGLPPDESSQTDGQAEAAAGVNLKDGTNSSAAANMSATETGTPAGDATNQRRSRQDDRRASANPAPTSDAKPNNLNEQAPPVATSSVNDASAAVVATTAQETTGEGVSALVSAGRTLDRLAAAKSVHPNSNATDDARAPTVDRVRFVQRVGSALRLAHQRDSQIQLRLSPPELGSLRLEISVKQGALTATLEAETAAARNILLDNLPALRERLAEQDIRIERFDVDVRREAGQQSGNPAAEDRHGRRSQDGSTSQRTGVEKNRGTIKSQSTSLADLTTSIDVGLDVVI